MIGLLFTLPGLAEAKVGVWIDPGSINDTKKNKELIKRALLKTHVQIKKSNTTEPEIEPAIDKTIAITIDDLPFVGEYRNFHLKLIMDALQAEHVPATGFIIASEVRNDNWDMLRQLRDAGISLGNHTLTHANLNELKTSEFINEISAADKILLPVMTSPKYFRYPYLAVSSGDKKNKVLCYLANNDYEVAPISVDSKDFVFNQRLLAVTQKERRDYFDELKPFYLDFIWDQTLKAEDHNRYHHNSQQAQILLVHANLLNAYALTDIIHLYKQNGYRFVTLEDALKNFKENIHCAKKSTNTVKADAMIEKFIDWD